MALAEKVGFADGLLGQGSVKAKEEGVKSQTVIRAAA